MKEFRQVVESRDIRTQDEYIAKWLEEDILYRRLGVSGELVRFPSNPEDIYKNFTWPGRRYQSYQNRFSPQNIFSPEETAKRRIRRQEHQQHLALGLRISQEYNPPSVEEFRKVVESRDIRTQDEYIAKWLEEDILYRRLGVSGELVRFPSNPEDIYKNFTWPGSG